MPFFCGNSRIDTGETCDDGVRNSNAPNAQCRPTCVAARCGDGILDTLVESCDDGDTLSGDGCDAWCGIEHGAADPGIDLPFVKGEVRGQLLRMAYRGREIPQYVTVAVSSASSSLQSSAPGRPGTPHAPVGDTGPAVALVMAAGAAAGVAWLRRKK